MPQSPVLQAVVGDDQLGVWVPGEQEIGGFAAAFGDHHRGASAALDEQGFVARIGRAAVLIDLDTAAAVPAVAAGNDANAQATLLQVLQQRHHHRCFANSPRKHIAHHQQRHRTGLGRQPAVSIQGVAGLQQGVVEQADRPQQPGQRAAPLPTAAQRMQQSGGVGCSRHRLKDLGSGPRQGPGWQR